MKQETSRRIPWQAEQASRPVLEQTGFQPALPAEKPQKKKLRRPGRRQLILSAMVLALGAAVYLNWKFVSEPVTAGKEEPSAPRYYGEAELAGTEVSVLEEDAVLSAAKTERRQQIDTAKAELNRQSADEKLPREERQKAAEKLRKLADQAAACTQMETRILAKGVADCVVYYDGRSAHVLVSCGTETLTADTVTAIRDVVISATELPVSSITVAQVSRAPEKESAPAESGASGIV